jgi:signal peptidase II
MSERPKSRRHVSAAARWGMVLGALVVVLAIDQLTKRWALERLAPVIIGGPREIIEVLGPLRFNLAFNTGASFSMGSDSGAIIGLVAIGIVVVLALVARKVESKVQLVLIGIIMGGALGNIIDRLTRVGEIDPFTGEVSSGFMSGAVIDFIDVQFWPIWNVADMAVVVGGIALAVLSAFAPEDAEPGDPDVVEGAGPAGPDDAAVDDAAAVESTGDDARVEDGAVEDAAQGGSPSAGPGAG